jgi:pyruvate ferredoxin oxidoreductase alpha subunit
MRLPIVMAVANRALSSPINIWNDHSDTISLRDSSWIQLYCESSQEAYDTIIQAYKIAENEKVKLPIMVCIDGFILSHVFEPVELDNEIVKRFLPAWKPENKLDVKKPMTFGALAYPKNYSLFKKQQQKAMENSIEVISKANSDFAKIFKRSYGNGLIEEYKTKDAKFVFVAMGSVCSTIREVVDELRAKKIKAGLIKVKSFRPFPYDDLKKALNGKEIAVIDKDFSYGANAALFTEIKSMCLKSKVKSFVMGLGGKDITKNDLKNIPKMMKNKEEVVWQ